MSVINVTSFFSIPYLIPYLSNSDNINGTKQEKS